MCSRVAFRILKEALIQCLQLGQGGIETFFEPRFNIAPSGNLVTIRQTEGGHQVGLRFWGLVPSWCEGPAYAKKWATFNARAETLASRPSFRAAFKHSRCLIPVEGWYEWRGPKGAKDAFFFKHQDEAEQLVFAGLFETWEGPEGSLQSCTVVTTEPNTVAAAIHTRMPVVLAPEAWDAWLDPATPAADLQALLAPCPDEVLHVHPVDRAVGNVRAQGEHLMAPLVR